MSYTTGCQLNLEIHSNHRKPLPYPTLLPICAFEAKLNRSMETWKIKKFFYNHKPLFFIGVVVLLVFILSGAFIYFSNSGRKDLAKASSIDFANGQISLDKVYVTDSTEVSSVTTTPSSLIKVRLKYNNTSTFALQNATIFDTIPDGFNFIPGTIINCFVDAECVNLDDSLTDGKNLAVGPLAGYFGYEPNSNSSSTILELGKYKYINLSDCVYVDEVGDRQSFNYDILNTGNGKDGMTFAYNDMKNGVSCASQNSLAEIENYYNQLIKETQEERKIRLEYCDFVSTFKGKTEPGILLQIERYIKKNNVTNTTCPDLSNVKWPDTYYAELLAESIEERNSRLDYCKNLDLLAVKDNPEITELVKKYEEANKITITTCNDFMPEKPYNALLDSQIPVNILGNRYFHLADCSYVSKNKNEERDIVSVNYDVNKYVKDQLDPITFADNNSYSINNCPDSSLGELQNSALLNLDLLGNRYIHLGSCEYLEGTDTFSFNYNYNNYPNNDPDDITFTFNERKEDEQLICPDIKENKPVSAKTTIIDLSDTSRGFGYIEYSMFAPEKPGSYGANSILTADAISTLVTSNLDTILVEGNDDNNPTDSPGLHLYYNANNPSSYAGSGQTISDLSGKGNNATLGGDGNIAIDDPVFDPSTPKSFVLNGDSQFIQTSLASNFSLSVSMEIWFKRTNNNEVETPLGQRLISSYSSGQNTDRLSLGITGKVLEAKSSAPDQAYSSNNFIPNTDWQMATLTYNSATSTGNIYVNGVLKNTFYETLSAGSAGNILIGQFNNNNFFQGRVSIVRIYGNELSSAEISNNFNAEKDIFGYTNSTINTTNSASSVSFTPTAATSNASEINVSLGSIVFSDKRDTFTPWTATISITNFESSNYILPAKQVTLDVGGLNVITGDGDNFTLGTSGNFNNPNSPKTLLTNTSNNGGGVVSLNPTLTVNIPPFTRSGNYTASIVISYS